MDKECFSPNDVRGSDAVQGCVATLYKCVVALTKLKLCEVAPWQEMRAKL